MWTLEQEGNCIIAIKYYGFSQPVSGKAKNAVKWLRFSHFTWKISGFISSIKPLQKYLEQCKMHAIPNDQIFDLQTGCG